MRRVAIPENRSVYVASWCVAAVLGILAPMGEPGGHPVLIKFFRAHG